MTETLSLGSRMKSYEDNTRLAKGVVIVRVDGKSFHTWTKQANLKRPFDFHMHVSMLHAAKHTAKEMQGFKLTYTQSDECTFAIANLEEMAGGWFDYKLQKLTSVTASLFTFYFNRHINKFFKDIPPAIFDARAFSIPVEDAANAFVWRQQDNARNWVQAYAAHKLSHKQIQGFSNGQVLEILEGHGHAPSRLSKWIRCGTFLNSDGAIHGPKDYAELNEIMGFTERVLNAAYES